MDVDREGQNGASEEGMDEMEFTEAESNELGEAITAHDAKKKAAGEEEEDEDKDEKPEDSNAMEMFHQEINDVKKSKVYQGKVAPEWPLNKLSMNKH